MTENICKYRIQKLAEFALSVKAHENHPLIMLTTEKTIYEGLAEMELLVYKDGEGDNNKGLMNADGTLLTNPVYSGFKELSGGYLKVFQKKDDGTFSGVMSSGGTLLTEVTYDRVYGTTLAGYERLEKKNESGGVDSSLAGPQGLIAKGLNNIDSSLLIKDPDNILFP